MSKRDCPCHSGLRYAACCEPFHSGASEAPTPETLMRSRYAAFALGLGEYLVKTLASTHPDLTAPRAALVADLAATRDSQRFAGLRILHTAVDGARGEVLFFARIYVRGGDASFAELSQFALEDGAWRYASGVLVDGARLPRDVATLTKDAFLALAA